MPGLTSLCHWGPFVADVENGRLTTARPAPGSGANPDMIGAWPDLVHGPTRIDQPYVRRGYLEKGIGTSAGRGHEEMVPVSWDVALDLAASEIRRVRDTYGPASILGGSYGWSSAGRFHHARTQLHRFLAAAGGFTDQVGNYSWGAANAILPHVLGSASAVSGGATAWETIAGNCDTLVAFGGLNAKNWHVTAGGAQEYHMPQMVAQALKTGTQLVIVSPNGADCPDGLERTLIQPRPNSDTAIMLALAHEALATGRADMDFLATYTEGHAEFCAYLTGQQDGLPKTLDWAAGIAGLEVGELQTLWNRIAKGRVMLTASWSLQRADHGEQSFWALIGLAAMLGQIGLPGCGFCFGYGSANGVGASSRKGFVPMLGKVANSVSMRIPVAKIVDMLLYPGKEINFDGQNLTYPDTRLVYWAGGNPFHHAQDLNKLDRAWQRPDTIIVNEPWWTPTAKRADIVFPATTTAERNDIGGSSRDPFVTFMPKLIEPVGGARNDFTIFQNLSDRLGCRASFDEGRDEEGWLRYMWSATQAKDVREGVEVPDFDQFRANGRWRVPAPEKPEVMLDTFRDDPVSHPLATPSGRIELHSAHIAGLALSDCPAHPTWLPPHEWLGNAPPDMLHLLTNQPAGQLHSQLYQTRKETGPSELTLNPEDGASRGLGDGDIARMENDRGACLGVVRLDAGLRAGVAIMATGSWFAPDQNGLEQNGNPNVLTADRQTSALGQACAAQSTLVRVGPANDKAGRAPVAD